MLATKNITNKLILIFLVVLPWSGFLMKRIDMWHAQGQFAQIGILILFTCSFIFGNKKVIVKNIPLGALILWLGVQACYFQYQAMLVDRYNNAVSFLTFFNVLCMILFYWVCVQHLNREDIKTILKWFSCSVLLMLFYCSLQALNIDPFFKVLTNLPYPQAGPAVVGTIGNATHLAGFLGICLPLFFRKRFKDISVIVLIAVILLFFTNFTGSIAISGVIVALGSAGYYLFRINKRLLIALVCISTVIFTIAYISRSEYTFAFDSGGRIGYWKTYFNMSKDTFLFGKGLGSVNVVSQTHPDVPRNVRHLHNEYLQIHFEAGFIALMILLYALWEFFKLKIKKDRTSLVLRAMFFGFIVSCLFNFQGHLWVITTVAMFCYAGIYAIKNEELNYDSYQIRT